MIKYIKDGKISSFRMIGDKVACSIIVGDNRIIYPTQEQMLQAGYEVYVEPIVAQVEPTPYVPTIEELVESKVRERYSINQEFQVNRKRDTEPDAFQAYYDYVEECIAWAYQQDHREEESV